MTLTRIIRLCSIVCFLSAKAWAAPEVGLLLEGDAITPSTTLEIRFAREMVTRDLLGVEVAESPLVFQPALVGKFTWLSQRSGVFVPSEAPKMGTTFVVALRPKLLDAGKKPVVNGFRAVLKTPPFQIATLESGVSEGDPAPPLPAVRLAFNRDVKLEGAEKLFRFVDDAGKLVKLPLVVVGTTGLPARNQFVKSLVACTS